MPESEDPQNEPPVVLPLSPLGSNPPQAEQGQDDAPQGADEPTKAEPTQTEPTQSVPLSSDPTGQVFVVEDESTGTDDAGDAADRPGALRTATVVSGRIILGFVIVAVIAIVVAAASLVPIPHTRAQAVSTLVTPVPTSEQLVCPGGLLRLGSASGAGANTPAALGAPQISSGAVPGDIIPTDFAVSDAHTGRTAAAPRLLTTPSAAGAAAAKLAGAQSEAVSTDDFGGLSSAACVSASASAWLSGGATSTGRTTLLLLANPTGVAATVSIQLFGETGRVTAPGMDGIAVAAGSQRVLSIAGFGPGLSSPVVHVTSSGGQVVATLEQSTVRGLIPGGIDFIGPQSAALKQTVIPGVVVSGTAIVQSDIGQPGFEDLQSTLRVFVPGAKSTTVTITVLAEDGGVTATPTRERVAAGTVTDLPLDSLSDGSYTFVIASDAPVVASIRTSTAGSASVGGDTDFAWATTAPLLTGDTVMSAAPGMTDIAHLYNPTGASETVHLRALAGQSLEATLAPHSAAAIPVQAGITYELTGVTALYASVSGQTDGGVTSYVAYPAPRGVGPLRVFG